MGGNGKEKSGGLKRLPNSSKALNLCGTSWVTERLRCGQLTQHCKLTTAAKAESPRFDSKHKGLAWLERLSYYAYCEIELIAFPWWQALNARVIPAEDSEKSTSRLVGNVSAWISADGRSLPLPKYLLYKNKPIPWIYLVEYGFTQSKPADSGLQKISELTESWLFKIPTVSNQINTS